MTRDTFTWLEEWGGMGVPDLRFDDQEWSLTNRLCCYANCLIDAIEAV